MRTYVLLFLFLIFAAANGFSQTSRINDSLHHQLYVAKTDTAKVWAMHDLSFSYLVSNADSAMWYAQMALELSKKVAFIRGEIRSMNDVGNVMQYGGNSGAALQILLEALQKAEALNDIPMQAICIGNIAIVYLSQGDYRQAKKYNFAALNIDIANHDTLYQAIDCENLSETYLKNNQPDSALFYGNQS